MDEPFELRKRSGSVRWAMTWPALAAAIGTLFFAAQWTTVGISLAWTHTAYFGLKALLIPRAVAKEYKGFWIGVVRDEAVGRGITRREHWLIARRMILPQLLTLAVLVVLAYYTRLGHGLWHTSWITWFIGSDFDLLMTKYRGFRLQGYRRTKTTPSSAAGPIAPASLG